MTKRELIESIAHLPDDATIPADLSEICTPYVEDSEEIILSDDFLSKLESIIGDDDTSYRAIYDPSVRYANFYQAMQEAKNLGDSARATLIEQIIEQQEQMRNNAMHRSTELSIQGGFADESDYILHRDNPQGLRTVGIQHKIRDAIANLSGRKNPICVVNFTDPKTPCSGFIRGETDTEAELCYGSNLYNVLSDSKFKPFYELDSNDGGYTDVFLITPNIVFMLDGNGNMLEKPVQCDVLSIAIPNLKEYLATNPQNPYMDFDLDGMSDSICQSMLENRATWTPERTYESTLKRRIETVITNAIAHGYRHIVLGMPKETDPKLIGKVYKEILDDQRRYMLFNSVTYVVGEEGSEHYKDFIRGLGKEHIYLRDEGDASA